MAGIGGYSSNTNSSTSNTHTGYIDANVTQPGPTGTIGDMKTNPIANPNIGQTDVSSTQHISRNTSDFADTRTMAGQNTTQDKKEAADNVDPEKTKILNKAVFTHTNSSPKSSSSAAGGSSAPSESAKYGE